MSSGLDFDQIDAVLDLDVRAGGFDRNVANPRGRVRRQGRRRSAPASVTR